MPRSEHARREQTPSEPVNTPLRNAKFAMAKRRTAKLTPPGRNLHDKIRGWPWMKSLRGTFKTFALRATSPRDVATGFSPGDNRSASPVVNKRVSTTRGTRPRRMPVAPISNHIRSQPPSKTQLKQANLDPRQTAPDPGRRTYRNHSVRCCPSPPPAEQTQASDTSG